MQGSHFLSSHTVTLSFIINSTFQISNFSLLSDFIRFNPLFEPSLSKATNNSHACCSCPSKETPRKLIIFFFNYQKKETPKKSLTTLIVLMTHLKTSDIGLCPSNTTIRAFKYFALLQSEHSKSPLNHYLCHPS